jgi:hypothetical protein
MNRLFLALLLSLISSALLSQNSIRGRIVDQQTGEAVPFANVFFANTTIGASTDVRGEFSFAGFPSGKYDLTITFVGYITYQTPVKFEGNTQLIVNQKIAQETKVLTEIVVKADSANRKRNFELFKNAFLGNSSNARKCEILNAKDVYLFYDMQEGVLAAHAKRPIVVENKATGYRIKYYLVLFELSSRTGLLKVFGFPQFEEMEPKNDRQAKDWLRERQKIYTGSILHFMRAWKSQEWIENKFLVSRMYKVANRERPSEQFLKMRIEAIKRERIAQGKSTDIVFNFADKPRVYNGDSLSYYVALRGLPSEVDSLINESLRGNEFDTTSNGLKTYRGLLKIRFDQSEDVEYARQVGRYRSKQQQSLIHILEPIEIFENGYYEPANNIFIEGYWSWSEKIATLLPLNFDLEKN